MRRLLMIVAMAAGMSFIAAPALAHHGLAQQFDHENESS